ncbi:uncharacterized protein METZ01_LOCUS443585, partial [marine metagenome]
MGAFSKIFKGIKKGFKKIGKGVKSAFQKFGKFMGKIGILGQIAMMFILPGIGNALLSSFSGLWTSAMQGLSTIGKGVGLGAKVAKAAAWTMGKAQQFAQFGQAGFKTVTDGVTKFFEHTGKYVGGKLGIAEVPNITAGEAWQNYQ